MDAEGLNLTTRASRAGSRPRLDERGQSVLEFCLMLPMMIALVVILVKVNTAIQISIVNQQYARAQALWLTFNSPVYPPLAMRESQLTAKSYNQMVIGVSDNVAPTEGDFIPKATIQNVSRKKNAGSDEAKTEPNQRGKVRIRDTVTLCTQLNVNNGKPLLPLGGGGQGRPFQASGPSTVSDTTMSKMDFCKSPMTYL